MKSISSVEFRKTYQRIAEPVTVTSDGRPIGRWTPLQAIAVPVLHDPDGVVDRLLTETSVPTGSRAPTFSIRYDTRPIRPVPKKGK